MSCWKAFTGFLACSKTTNRQPSPNASEAASSPAAHSRQASRAGSSASRQQPSYQHPPRAAISPNAPLSAAAIPRGPARRSRSSQQSGFSQLSYQGPPPPIPPRHPDRPCGRPLKPKTKTKSKGKDEETEGEARPTWRQLSGRESQRPAAPYCPPGRTMVWKPAATALPPGTRPDRRKRRSRDDRPHVTVNQDGSTWTSYPEEWTGSI